MIVLALLVQAAAATPAPPVPQRFSILADPCGRVASDPASGDVVVCGQRMDRSQRLPLPGERGPPDRPLPVNPDGSGSGALAAQAPPCSARLGGCLVGVGPPPELVNAVIDGVSGALKARKWRAARRRDGAARVPIDLTETARPSAPSAQDVQP